VSSSSSSSCCCCCTNDDEISRQDQINGVLIASVRNVVALMCIYSSTSSSPVVVGLIGLLVVLMMMTMMITMILLKRVADVVQHTSIHTLHLTADADVFHFIVNQPTANLALPLPSCTTQHVSICSSADAV